MQTAVKSTIYFLSYNVRFTCIYTFLTYILQHASINPLIMYRMYCLVSVRKKMEPLINSKNTHFGLKCKKKMYSIFFKMIKNNIKIDKLSSVPKG